MIAGKSSVIECMASGSPKPTLSWLKDGEPIEVTERHFFAAEDQLLIIVDTTDSDAGTYACTMQNELGSRKGIMQLKVKAATAPTVVNSDEMTGIVIITVVCCAVGTSIVWVVIIYQTKKGRGCTNYPASPDHHRSTTAQRYEGAAGNNGLISVAAANRLMIEGKPKSILLLNENEALLTAAAVTAGGGDKYSAVHPNIIPNGGVGGGGGGGVCSGGLAAALNKKMIENQSPNSEYNYDDVDSGTGDSAKRSTTTNDFYSDNGTSEMCCIEVDKTAASSPTVSYKTSPTTTPCHDDEDDEDDDDDGVDGVDCVDDVDHFSDVLSAHHLHPTHHHHNNRHHQRIIQADINHPEMVNIQTNRLNDYLQQQQMQHHQIVPTIV